MQKISSLWQAVTAFSQASHAPQTRGAALAQRLKGISRHSIAALRDRAEMNVTRPHKDYMGGYESCFKQL